MHLPLRKTCSTRLCAAALTRGLGSLRACGMPPDLRMPCERDAANSPCVVGKGSDYYGATETISSVLLLHQRRLARVGARSHDSEEIFARYLRLACQTLGAHTASRVCITNKRCMCITVCALPYDGSADRQGAASVYNPLHILPEPAA